MFVSISSVQWGKDKTDIRRKKETTLSLFAANIIVYTEKPPKIDKLLEFLRESSKVAKYENWVKVFVIFITDKKLRSRC